MRQGREALKNWFTLLIGTHNLPMKQFITGRKLETFFKHSSRSHWELRPGSTRLLLAPLFELIPQQRLQFLIPHMSSGGLQRLGSGLSPLE